MAVHISPVRIQGIKERWEKEVLYALARQERRLKRPREALAHTLVPFEPEDLVAAQGRQEEQAERSTVTRLIEALDERPDLLVRKDACARGLVLFRHTGSRILLEESLSNRPSEETAEGAKLRVAGACLESKTRSMSLGVMSLRSFLPSIRSRRLRCQSDACAEPPSSPPFHRASGPSFSSLSHVSRAPPTVAPNLRRRAASRLARFSDCGSSPAATRPPNHRRELARGGESDGGVIADAIATHTTPLTLPSPPEGERVC